jgi:pentatricopeptide repeat protein
MLINVWARQKNPEEARYVMSLMKAAGIAPDVVSYNTLAQVRIYSPPLVFGKFTNVFPLMLSLSISLNLQEFIAR